MYKMMFSYQPQNNAVLSSTKAMPQKDTTSDGAGSFAIARHEYAETITATPDTISEQLKKKWFGSRDASDIATKRRVREIGVGTLNAGQNDFAFMNKNDNNSRVDALARVRGGGYVVPPKVRNRKTSDGVPVLAPPVAVPVVRSVHRLPMVPTREPPGAPYRKTKVRLSDDVVA
jgi:hypothetical protein